MSRNAEGMHAEGGMNACEPWANGPSRRRPITVEFPFRRRPTGEMVVPSIVTLACDPGDRYLTTYYDDGWLRDNGHDIEPYLARMRAFYSTGIWST